MGPAVSAAPTGPADDRFDEITGPMKDFVVRPDGTRPPAWTSPFQVRPFIAGLDRDGDFQIYTSRGTGYWGPPMRVGAPSEISSLTLRRDPTA